MANEIDTVVLEQNEIAKQEDLQFGADREFSNLYQVMAALLGLTENAVLSGGTVTQRGSPSMNVDLQATMAFDATARTFLFTDAVQGPIPLTASHPTQDRIDILEIQLVVTPYDTQQRAFKDPTLGSITYQDIQTKKRIGILAQVKAGIPGSGLAPNTDAGWVKMAEIAVPAAVTSILTANIKNITATVPASDNAAWTAEKQATYLLKPIEFIKSLIRTPLNEDGTFKNVVIKDENIDWGTSTHQIDLLARLIATGMAGLKAPTYGIGNNNPTAINVDLNTVTAGGHYAATYGASFNFPSQIAAGVHALLVLPITANLTIQVIILEQAVPMLWIRAQTAAATWSPWLDIMSSDFAIGTAGNNGSGRVTWLVGTGGAGFGPDLKIANLASTAVNPNKYLRIGSNGELFFRNSANNANIMTLENDGTFRAPFIGKSGATDYQVVIPLAAPASPVNGSIWILP